METYVQCILKWAQNKKKPTSKGKDGICIRANVSGKWKTRYQMLTIRVAVVACSRRTGAVPSEGMEPEHSCVCTEITPSLSHAVLYADTFFFSSTVSGLQQQQHITAIAGVTQLFFQFICPLALICRCVQYDFNIKTVYIVRPYPFLLAYLDYFAWYKIQSCHQKNQSWCQHYFQTVQSLRQRQ